MSESEPIPKAYLEIARCPLVDQEKNTLTLIVESNLRSFKVFMIYRLNGQPPSEARYSQWWSFTDATRAMAEARHVIESAEAKGWVSLGWETTKA